MRFGDKSCPCYGCDKRCVSLEHNCHSDCEKYKQWVEANDEKREAWHKSCKEDYQFIDTRNKALHKIDGKLYKERAWRG